MKKIQEMKLGELARFLPAKRTEGDCIGEPYMKVTDSEWGAIPYRVLKLWAKMIVKNCKNKVKDVEVGVVMSEKAPIYCGHTYSNSPVVERCDSCKRWIKKFELKKGRREGNYEK